MWKKLERQVSRGTEDLRTKGYPCHRSHRLSVEVMASLALFIEHTYYGLDRLVWPQRLVGLSTWSLPDIVFRKTENYSVELHGGGWALKLESA